MKSRIRFGIIALLFTTASPAFAVTNLLTNGSFETGNFSGWTVSNSNSNAAALVTTYNNTAAYPANPVGENIPTDTISTGSPDSAGNDFAYFSTDTGYNAISQTVSLLAGHTYTFGFDYYLPANGYANPNNFSIAVTLAGQALSTFNSDTAAAKQWYTAMSTTSIASATSGPLTFTFSGQGSPAKDAIIDRVYLIDSTSAVPEPASWAMMIAGFGIVGFAMRRRRKLALA